MEKKNTSVRQEERRGKRPVRQPERNTGKPAKKRSSLLWLWICLGLVAVIAVTGFALFEHYYSKLNVTSRESYEPEPLAPADVDDWRKDIPDDVISGMDEALEKNQEQEIRDQEASVKNILLIGVDNDNMAGINSRGNADGLIIASVNTKTKKVVLSSLMRDIYLTVPGMFNTKITLSYHYGGVDALIDAVETNFGVPIDNYLLVNYLNVIDIVDALGGVTLDVTSSELYYMETKINNLDTMLGRYRGADVISPDNAGTILLNGVQAAAYMRVRSTGNGDFDRTGRARSVLLAMKEKAAQMSVTELNSLADVVLPCITTDMSETDILYFLVNAPSMLGYSFESYRIPIDDAYGLANYGSAGAVVTVDFDKNREFLEQVIYGED